MDIEGAGSVPFPGLGSGAAASPAAPLVLGIRPENFARAGSHDEATLAAAIRFVEPLGSDTLIFFMVGETEVIARLPPAADLKEGRTIPLTIDFEKSPSLRRRKRAAHRCPERIGPSKQ